jgi:hypothetical protein
MALRQPFRTISMLFLVSSLAACTLPGGAVAPADAVPTSTQPAPPTLGQCSNPLQPVIVGATWTYTVSGITTGTFTRSISDVRTDGFTDQNASGGATTSPNGNARGPSRPCHREVSALCFRPEE